MFLFVICQAGAEAALKAEVLGQWPEFRFSYSRPGFVTFRIPADLGPDLDLKSTFARTYGQSLGRLTGSIAERLAAGVWELVGDRPVHRLHVWERDRSLPGTDGFQPGPTVLATEMAQLIVGSQPEDRAPIPINTVAGTGHTVLDCVLVEPGEWWIGIHKATSPQSRWPGGVCRVSSVTEPVSRAFYKMEEGLRWSMLPVARGDACAEIGCAPGGAAQALLARGVTLLGIDPAEVDERMSEYPGFSHIRKRAADMKRRDFREVRWLFLDANIAPQSALDEIEPIISHESVHIRGMLLTLKLVDSRIADAIPDYLERVRSWGFEYVRSRQLAFSRREFCIAAMRNRGMRRPSLRRQKRAVGR
jgi:23S rRNA (cytidine2498-2'-O)-methyltransferase